MFGNHWGPPHKLEAKLTKLVLKEIGCPPEALECRVEQQRETLSFGETFVAPLNNTPSHVCLFHVAARDREVVMEVDIDGDRDCPLGVQMRGTAWFKPGATIAVKRGVIGTKFIAGLPEDTQRLTAAGLGGLLKRCTNSNYANVINPATFLRIDPIRDGCQVLAFCMPKDRWGFGLFDQLNIGHFFSLLEGLDKIG